MSETQKTVQEVKSFTYLSENWNETKESERKSFHASAFI